MKAIAKLFRVEPDGNTLRPVEAMPGTGPKLLLESEEKAVVQLWHGNCLEAVVEITRTARTNSPELVLVRLVEKKELRPDAPPEAICS